MVIATAIYNPQVIILSFGISFLGAYITICLCEQFRICSLTGNKPRLLNRNGLLAMMSCSLGGIGIWSMHFVGMSAMRLEGPDNEDIPVRFHIFTTLISLLFVLLFAWAGLFIGSNDKVFTKSKKEIVETFVKDSSALSLKQVRLIKSSHIMCIICTQSLQYLFSGGMVAGAGVCVMHYLGMWAMEFDGEIIWDEGIIAASILIAIIASTAAFWILYRLLSLYPCIELLRLSSAFIMAVAVCGMHYTGMMAAKFDYQGKSTAVEEMTVMGTVSNSDAFTGALVAAVLFFVILVIMTMADLRAWLFTTTAQLHKADELLISIHTNHYSGAIHKYLSSNKYIRSFHDLESQSYHERGSYRIKPVNPREGIEERLSQNVEQDFVSSRKKLGTVACDAPNQEGLYRAQPKLVDLGGGDTDTDLLSQRQSAKSSDRVSGRVSARQFDKQQHEKQDKFDFSGSTLGTKVGTTLNTITSDSNDLRIVPADLEVSLFNAEKEPSMILEAAHSSNESSPRKSGQTSEVV